MANIPARRPVAMLRAGNLAGGTRCRPLTNLDRRGFRRPGGLHDPADRGRDRGAGPGSLPRWTGRARRSTISAARISAARWWRRTELRDGRGFAVMAGLPVERWRQEDAERTRLGTGMSQSRRDRLGHVRDVTRGRMRRLPQPPGAYGPRDSLRAARTGGVSHLGRAQSPGGPTVWNGSMKASTCTGAARRRPARTR